MLTSADDLNTITSNGTYWYLTDSVPAHAPYNNSAIVEVYGSTSNTTQKIQRVTRYGVSGQSAFRPLIGGNWLDWDYIITKASIDIKLWSGTWTTGSITVPGLQDYTIFRITMADQGTDIIATRHTQFLRGIGGYCRSTTDASIYFLAATVSNNTLTFSACTAWNMGKQSWDAMAVNGIYGIS